MAIYWGIALALYTGFTLDDGLSALRALMRQRPVSADDKEAFETVKNKINECWVDNMVESMLWPVSMATTLFPYMIMWSIRK